MLKESFIVVIGGAITAGSSTECAVEMALGATSERGARVQRFDGPSFASLAHYTRSATAESRVAHQLLAAVRADELVIASPAIMVRYQGW